VYSRPTTIRFGASMVLSESENELPHKLADSPWQREVHCMVALYYLLGEIA